MVHQLREQLDRAHHHRGRRDQLHQPRHRPTRTTSRPGPTAPCGSPTARTTRSGTSPPRASSPTTPAPTIDRPEAITAGPDGALWFNNAINNSIGRITISGVVTNYTGPPSTFRVRASPAPTAPCGSPTQGSRRSVASRHREMPVDESLAVIMQTTQLQMARPRASRPCSAACAPSCAVCARSAGSGGWRTNRAA